MRRILRKLRRVRGHRLEAKLADLQPSAAALAELALESRAKPCRPCGPSISGRRTRSRKPPLRWRGADARSRSSDRHSQRPAPLDASAMAAIHARLLRQELGRGRDRHSSSACPGCLACSVAVDLGRRSPQGFLIARSAGDEAELSDARASTRLAAALGLARALLAAAIGSLARRRSEAALSRGRRGQIEPRAAFTSRSEQSPSGAVRAIMSMAPTPTSSVLPFEARLRDDDRGPESSAVEMDKTGLTGKPDRAPLRRAGDAHDRSAPDHRQGAVGGRRPPRCRGGLPPGERARSAHLAVHRLPHRAPVRGRRHPRAPRVRRRPRAATSRPGTAITITSST